MNGYKEINLETLAEAIGEDKTKRILADYSCPLNPDIEDFARNKALLFSKQNYARTHLVFASYKGEPVLVGFYALAYKSVQIKATTLNSKWRHRLNRFATYSEISKSYWISLPLIGQLGKNFINGYNKLITGDELLKLACDRISRLQAEVGGKMAYLECEDIPELVNFYMENGFYRFANRNLDHDEIGNSRYLVQMIRYFD